MGTLAAAKPAIIVCTRDRDRSAAFYRDVLGLTLVRDDPFATVFDAGGVQIRVSLVPDFVAHEHTIVGFGVPDVRAAVAELGAAGAAFKRFAHMQHDDLGVVSLPGGVHAAWTSDPDGNVLSIHDAP